MALPQLDEHLKTRSYLVGRELTLADFVVFAAVHSAVSGFSEDQVRKVCHVQLRPWQNTYRRSCVSAMPVYTSGTRAWPQCTDQLLCRQHSASHRLPNFLL